MVNCLNHRRLFVSAVFAWWRSLALGAFLLLLSAICCPAVSAHSPHDDCFDVKLSPGFPVDRSVYAIVRSNLMISRDGGDTWQRKIRGLDHKHMLYSLDVAVDGQTIYLASIGDGVYRSPDAGESWQRINQDLGSLDIDLVAVSPGDSRLVFAAGVEGGLFRTDTAGARWVEVGDSFDKITAIAFTQGMNEHILAGDSRGQIHQSTDGGRSWQRVYQTDRDDAITALTVLQTPSNARVIMFGTGKGRIGRSAGEGQPFILNTLASESEPVVDLKTIQAISGKVTVYASLWDKGVFRSDDGGVNWQLADRGLTRDRQSEKLGRPSFSKISISADYHNDGTLFVAGYDGLFKSVDKGQDWTELETLSPYNVMGLAVSPEYSEDGTVIFTNWLWGAYFSNDKGASWQPINSGAYEHFVRENGVVRLFNVVFSPAYKQDRTLFTSTWYRLLKSTDDSREWQQIVPLKDGSWGKTHHGQVIAVSPDFHNDQNVFIGTHRGVLLKSVDAGETFHQALKINGLIGDVVISPNYAHDQALFISDTSGVHLSRDRGLSWNYEPIVKNDAATIPISPIYPTAAVEAWRKHQQFERAKAYSIKLAISPSFAEDKTLFAGTAEGLFLSRNGGGQWVRAVDVNFPADAFIESIAVSPGYARDHTLLVVVRGQGVFRSQDRGQTFHPIASRMIEQNILFAHFVGIVSNFQTLVFSPSYAVDRTLYAYSGDNLFRSLDVGETWELVKTPRPGLLKRQYVWAAYHFSYLKRSKKFWVAVALIVVLPSYAATRIVRRYRSSGKAGLS